MSMVNEDRPRPPRPFKPPVRDESDVRKEPKPKKPFRPPVRDETPISKAPSAGPRREPQQRPQTRPQMPKQEAKSRLRDSRNVVPGGPGADTFLDDAMPFLRAPRDAALRGMEATMPFLQAPGRIARGAVEGGIQAIDPNFEMPFMPGSSQGRGMPMRRNIDPGTDAILRAIMARMQGGQ